MNKVILTGRLTKDIELAMTTNNLKVAKGSIAVRKMSKDKDGNYETIFIDFTAFNNTADFLVKFGKKGYMVLLEGYWDVSIYDKNGQKNRRDYLIVNNVELLESKKDTQPEQEEPKDDPKQNNLPDILEDDLPF